VDEAAGRQPAVIRLIVDPPAKIEPLGAPVDVWPTTNGRKLPPNGEKDRPAVRRV